MDARKFIEVMRSCEDLNPSADEIKGWWYLEKLIEDRDTVLLDNKSIVLIERALKMLKEIISETLISSDDDFYRELGIKDVSDINILLAMFNGDYTIQLKRRG